MSHPIQVEVQNRSDLWSDPRSTHMVNFLTKIAGSGIWFDCTITWSEVINVWVGLIRGGFKRTFVSSDKSLSSIGSDRTPFWAQFISIFCTLTKRYWLWQEATKTALWSDTHLEADGFYQNQRGLADSKCLSPKRKFSITVDHDVSYGKLSKFIHWVRNMH